MKIWRILPLSSYTASVSNSTAPFPFGAKSFSPSITIYLPSPEMESEDSRKIFCFMGTQKNCQYEVALFMFGAIIQARLLAPLTDNIFIEATYQLPCSKLSRKSG